MSYQPSLAERILNQPIVKLFLTLIGAWVLLASGLILVDYLFGDLTDILGRIRLSLGIICVLLGTTLLEVTYRAYRGELEERH